MVVIFYNELGKEIYRITGNYITREEIMTRKELLKFIHKGEIKYSTAMEKCSNYEINKIKY